MRKKKVTTVNIDENVLRLAKREIPNLSVFFEDCLRAYLGLDGNFNISSVADELECIKQSSLNIHILTSKEKETSFLTNVQSDKVNTIWNKVWGLYRTTDTVNNTDLTEAVLVLNIDKDSLLEMMSVLKTYAGSKNLLQCNTYSGAREVYCMLEDGVI